MTEEANGTPQSARRPRLGLTRRACHTTPLLRLQREDFGNTIHRTDQETPRALPLSTNSGCHKRIGLSRIRTELTKKRLEFAAVGELKEQAKKNELTPKAKANQPLTKENKPEKKTVDSKKQEDERGKIVDDKKRMEEDEEVKPQVSKKQEDERGKIVKDKNRTEDEDEVEMSDEDEVESDDESHEPQDSKIAELQADIETWRRGFIATVNDLQAMVVPRPTKKTVLIQLGIPLEMLRYLEED